MNKLSKTQLGLFLTAQKSKADFLLFCLSFLALALVATNEVLSLTQTTVTDVLGFSWSGILLGGRFLVWIFFVAHFLAYGLLSGNIRNYARSHLLEVVICMAWFPQSNDGMLKHITSVLSIEMVQLFGTLANTWLVLRYCIRRFQTHPLIVTSAAFWLVVLTASGLLMHFEPKTFSNWFDAIWYSIVTVTTIGYGDIVPHTFAGRLIGMGLMVCGIGLAGALIGIVSQVMQKRLGHESDVQKALEKNRELLERTVAALEKDNELKTQLLDELKRRRSGGDNG